MKSPLQKIGTRWPAILGQLVILLLWLLFWYRDSFWGMVQLWQSSDTYAHGVIVVPLVLWLCWIERQHLKTFTPQPTALFLPLLLGTTVAWLVGELAAVNIIPQFAAALMLILSIVSLIGSQLGKEMAFPLAFLLFAVPFGEFMMPSLMSWTADFTVLALRATGIPVYREGLSFVIPSGNWSVVEACSGIRYLIASLMVGTLFAYLNYQSLKRRLIFMLVALIVPIFANWLRAYFIVLLGHLSGNKLAAGFDHLIYGWVFFGLVIGLMFMIGIRWAEPRIHQQTPTSPQPQNNAEKRSFILPMLLVTSALGPLALLLMNNLATLKTTSPSLVVQIDAKLSPYQFQWTPAWANPTATLRQTYLDNDKPVQLFIAYYRNQTPFKKLISSTNLLVRYQDSDWSLISTRSDNLGFADQTIPVHTSEIASKSGVAERLLTHHWYWIGGQYTASDAKGKLLTAINRLLGHGDHSAVIVLATENDANATERLQHFATVNGKNIENLLIQAAQE